MAGRANDYRGVATKKNHDTSSKPTSFSLDYRDEFGRDLTSKEAFRQLSYRFHGQNPGKKKAEKRLKILKEEMARDKQLSGEGPSATMQGLERRQKHAKQAYVVLSGNATGVPRPM